MLADRRQVANRLHQAWRDVPRVRAGEPNPRDAWHLTHALEQRGKVTARIVRGLIVIDDLPQQLHLCPTAPRRPADLSHDVGHRSHALMTARVRDNAEGA